jgi:hypothetical protein
MNNGTEKEYSVVRLNGKNIVDLEKLYAAVYKKNAPGNYFAKKYDTVFTGVQHIGYLAYKEAIPIAFYGVIPCFIQYENNVILAAQSADTMTHPEHRYKNLFFDLSNMCFELCKQNGIFLIYGFPNQNSYHGAIKLGWQMSEIMDCFTMHVHLNMFEKALSKIDKKRRFKVLKKYSTNEIGLKNSVIRDGFSGVLRDKNFLKYKTYSNTNVLQIANSKVWISAKNSLSLGDIETDENNFDGMIEAIKNLAKKLGISTIYFHACKETLLHKMFSKKFESIQSFPVLFQNFNDSIDIKKIKFTFADIDIF